MLIRDLTAEGARVVAYDPVAMPATRQALPHHESITHSLSVRLFDGSAAVVLITAWPEFRELPQLLQGLEHSPLGHRRQARAGQATDAPLRRNRALGQSPRSQSTR